MKQTKRVSLLFVLIALTVCLSACQKSDEAKYKDAQSLMGKGQYIEAAAAFEELGSYEDAAKMVMYCKAADAGEKGNYDTAISTFELLGDFKESSYMKTYYTARKDEDSVYQGTMVYWGKWLSAAEAYDTIALFKDSTDRAENCKKSLYDFACSTAESDMNSAVRMFEDLGKYSDSSKLAKYYSAKILASKGLYKEASEGFALLGEFMDSAALAKSIMEEGYAAAEELEQKGSIAEAKKLFLSLGDYQDSSERAYKLCYDKGVSLRNEEKWDEAVEAFVLAEDYSDATTQIAATRYAEGEAKRTSKDWDGARTAFTQAGEYGDASTQISATYYAEGEAKRSAKDWVGAVTAFEKAGDYSDASSQKTETDYQHAIDLDESSNREEAYKLFLSLGNYKDAYEKACKPYYDEGVQLRDAGDQEGAIAAFEKALDYQDAKEQRQSLAYSRAEEYLEAGDELHAKQYFMKAYDYKDSWSRIQAIDRKYKDRLAATPYHAFAAKKDGTMLLTSHYDRDSLSDVTRWTNIVAISGCPYGVIGLRSDSTVVAAGDYSHNGSGKQETQDWTDIVEVAITDYHSYGVTNEGKVLSTVNTRKSSIREYSVSDWNNIVRISAQSVQSKDKDWFYDNVVGVLSDGRVVAAGRNDYGECDIAGWTDIVDVQTYDHVTIGLKSNGTIVMAGNVEREEYAAFGWTDIVQVARFQHGTSHYLIGLKADGKIVLTGISFYFSEDDWQNIMGLSTDDSIVMGLHSDGSIITFTDSYDWKHLKSGTAGWTLWSGSDNSVLESTSPSPFVKKSDEGWYISDDGKYGVKPGSISRESSWSKNYVVKFQIRDETTKNSEELETTITPENAWPEFSKRPVLEFSKQPDGKYKISFSLDLGTSKTFILDINLNVN